jgi:LuxR family maltose regulon positive regulatory protein
MTPGPEGLRYDDVPRPGEPRVPEPSRDLLERTRLAAFFDAVPKTPVSTIVAPAGCGKSAAVTWWTDHARAGGRDVRWVPASDVDAIAASLNGAHGTSAVVVVDDAHRLPPPAVDLLREHLERDPDSTRLLLVSRNELAFVPIRLTLNRRAQSLRAADLRLDPDEAAELVLARHPGIAPADLDRVVEEGDGWAAALVLASSTLRSPSGGQMGGGPRLAVTAVTHATLDYLADEVFTHFSSALQQVLLSTCHEPVVTANQAIVMSGLPSAGDVLDQAAEGGFLVTRTDDRSGSRGLAWRYHPMLVQLLHRRTAPGGPSWALLAQAHERAARHHRRLGEAAAAVHHAGRTGDVNLQLLVLREFTPELLATGHAGLVAAALRRIPDGVRDHLPAVNAMEALVLRTLRRYDAAKAAADRALALRPPRGDREPDRELQADLATLEVWQARRGWRPVGPAARRAAEVLHCEHDADRTASDHDTSGISPLRSAWLMMDLAALQLWTGDLELAALHVQAADAQQCELPRLTCALLSVRAALGLANAAYQSAGADAQACLELHAREMLTPGFSSARAHLVRGWARFQALDLDGAEADLGWVRAASPEPVDAFDLVYVHLLEANLLMARGATDEAKRMLDARGVVPETLPAYADRMARLARLQAAGRVGDLATVDAEATGLRTAGFRADATLVRALEMGVAGSERAAIHTLDVLLGEPGLPPVTATSAAVGRVALMQRLGTPSEVHHAQELVPDLLSRVAPQRLLWVLATGPLLCSDFMDLLSTEVARADAHPFAAEALTALEGYLGDRPRLPMRHPDPGRIRAQDGIRPWPAGLTDREVDVLRELALGGTNASIAHALFVSDNTVKTHLASIYRKLEVDSRAAALAAARDLHVL